MIIDGLNTVCHIHGAQAGSPHYSVTFLTHLSNTKTYLAVETINCTLSGLLHWGLD